MAQKRAYRNPLFGTLDYMQYIDYALQLQPNQSDILVREGFDIDSSLVGMVLVVYTEDGKNPFKKSS